MRVVLYDFVQAAGTPSKASEAVVNAGGVLVAWVARSKHMATIRAAAPNVRFFAAGGAARGRSDVGDVWFAPEEEENLLYLLDRESSYENHLESSQRRLEVLAWASELLAEVYADAILFSDVPHNVFSYCLYLLCRRAGTKILFFRLGPAPHLFSFGDNIESGLIDTHADGASRTRKVAGAKTPSDASLSYVKKLRKEYAAAAPSYMKAQKAKATLAGRIDAVVKNLTSAGPVVTTKKAVATLRRQRLKDVYEETATDNPRLDLPFVAVFLHLQPERSSIPEGGRYAQQYRMVAALSQALPDGWRLFVREHPSTFMAGPKLVRGPWAYQGLSQLPGVSLVSTKVSPFTLIDNSRCVATITGTVGFEAVARGKPAVVFGSAPYVGCGGVFRVRNSSEIRDALSAIKEGAAPDANAAELFLHEFEASHRTEVVSTGVPNAGAHWRTGESHVAVLELMLRHLTVGPVP